MLAIRFRKGIGEYGVFSNFHVNPFTIDEREYANTEAAFQAFKTTDLSRRRDFEHLPGRKAKDEGQKVILRPDWEDVKFQRMVAVNHAKYSQIPHMKKLLLSTGSALIIEDTTSWHDNEWGCCYCSRCAEKAAKNKLGLALMVVRSKLRGDNGIPVDIHFAGSNEFHIDLEPILNDKGLIEDDMYREAFKLAYRHAL